MKKFLTLSLSLLPLTFLSGCWCASDEEMVYEEPAPEVVEEPKYVPLTIRQRIHRMVYVKADNYGFQFLHDEENNALLANKYLFGEIDELPIKNISDIPVKVLTQKSNGTWLLSIDDSKYLINETNLRIWTENGEILYPERIVIVTQEDIDKKSKEAYEKALEEFKQSRKNKKEDAQEEPKEDVKKDTQPPS